MAGTRYITRDHERIRTWAEERGGWPAAVRSGRSENGPETLRLAFPDGSSGDSLERLSWDEWFRRFDDRDMVFLHQNTLPEGGPSRFNQLIRRETAERVESARWVDGEPRGRRRVDLWDCALGFMDSQMLLTAHDLGVFDALAEDARTPAEVASRVGIPEDSADRLLLGLCGLGIVRKTADGGFENGEEVSRKLVRDEPEYMGDMFRHVLDDLYPLWGHFRSALEEGEAQWDRAFGGDRPRNELMHEDPESRRAFHEGMHVVAFGAGQELASYAPELGELRSAVDIGGSTGGFLIALAQAFPRLEGVVFDLPGVEPIAESHFRAAGVADRLRFQGGDFFNDPFPEKADAYALGFVLHDWDEKAGRALIRKIADVSEPGARLIVGEYLLNDEKTGPRWVARSSLNMLVAAQGRERNAKEYVELVSPFGFGLEKIYLTSTGKNFMIFERK